MAKNKSFGTEDGSKDNSDRRMAKVIVATETGNNEFGYKEAIIDEDDVQEFINENKD